METKGEISAMDGTGDTKTIWDPANADEVAAAQATFDRLKGKGYVAFKVEGKDGEKGEQIREFNPGAGKYIMVPPMRGGC